MKDTVKLPADLRWTTDRPVALRQPLRPAPPWLEYVPDWVRRFVPWSWLHWFDSRYAVCWVEVVGWKLNGGAVERSFAVGSRCHDDARKCQRCYCNKIKRADITIEGQGA